MMRFVLGMLASDCWTLEIMEITAALCVFQRSWCMMTQLVSQHGCSALEQ